MLIGIDSSRAFIADKTGTENYSYHVITQMLRLPESREHTFVLFIRPNAILPIELDGYDNVIVKVIPFKYLWTQLGLAWATWGKYSKGKLLNTQIEVLWVPAHTLPVLRRPDIKTVVTIHGLEYQWLPEYKNWLQRWYLPLSTIFATKAANMLIAVSKFTAKQLEEQLHTNPKKIKVIHEGIEASKLENLSPGRDVLQKFGLQSKKYILFVGTVQPRKNLVALIGAFSHFTSGSARDMATDIKLVIAGGIGWMAGEVLAAPGKFGVQESVVFTGRVSESDLEKLYKSALLYVQPSVTEGFGLPILEAMGYGVPVVTSDGGALAEVAGNAALIIKLGLGREGARQFVCELAIAMHKLVKDSKLRSKLSELGKKRVGDFEWKKTAKETLRLLITV